MTTVTLLERQKGGRYTVAFDNGLTCTLYTSELKLIPQMEQGRELTEEEYRILIREGLGKRVKKRALHLLEQMDRTRQQLRDKLTQAGYPCECVEDAIAYVEKFHYIDDYRYACNYISFHQEKLSRRQLYVKLSQKGVSGQLIEAALEENYEGNEASQIHALLAKRRFDPAEADEKERARTYAFLARRGFSSADIRKAMRESGEEAFWLEE